MITCACCPNEARYATESGKLVCSLCAMRSGEKNIRISDDPALASRFAKRKEMVERAAEAVRIQMRADILDHFWMQNFKKRPLC